MLGKLNYKRVINLNGLNFNILEENRNNKNGTILLLHGFPELSYSFRKIIPLLSKQGFHVLAPDQRGYGLTQGWQNSINNLDSFNITNLAKDVILLINRLQLKPPIHIVGHDFGSFVASYCSLLNPNLFTSLILMSAPFAGPLTYKVINSEGYVSLNTLNLSLNRAPYFKKHYQIYFSSQKANHDIMNCKQGIHSFLRNYFYYKSADWKMNKPSKLNDSSPKSFLKIPSYYIMDHNKTMPETVYKIIDSDNLIDSHRWLNNEELKFYTNSFTLTNFQGALNWYKAMSDPLQIDNICSLNLDNTIKIPSYFIAGESDWGVYQKPYDFYKMSNQSLTNFKGSSFIKNAGHWVQQEQPEETAFHILKFLGSI